LASQIHTDYVKSVLFDTKRAKILLKLPGCAVLGSLTLVDHWQLSPTFVRNDDNTLKNVLRSAGNSLDYTEKDMEIMHEHGAAVKEMEAGAIGWVAQLLNLPLVCIKVNTRSAYLLVRRSCDLSPLGNLSALHPQV
jgi:hypothetical protein